MNRRETSREPEEAPEEPSEGFHSWSEISRTCTRAPGALVPALDLQDPFTCSVAGKDLSSG